MCKKWNALDRRVIWRNARCCLTSLRNSFVCHMCESRKSEACLKLWETPRKGRTLWLGRTYLRAWLKRETETLSRTRRYHNNVKCTCRLSLPPAWNWHLSSAFSQFYRSRVSLGYQARWHRDRCGNPGLVFAQGTFLRLGLSVKSFFSCHIAPAERS